MGKFLDWYALHNTLIIQSLAGFIAFLILLFIFRLFFADNSAMAHSAGGPGLDKLDDKLNKIIEHQKSIKFKLASSEVTAEDNTQAEMSANILAGNAQVAATAETTAATNSNSGVAAAAVVTSEVQKLSLEVETLKKLLAEKEAVALTMSATINTATTAAGSQSIDDVDGLQIKVVDYEKQIKNLKSRLSDYDIISEDLADLQKFKQENEELKKQLENSNLIVASVENASVVTDKAMEEVVPIISAAEVDTPLAEIMDQMNDSIEPETAKTGSLDTKINEVVIDEEPPEPKEMPPPEVKKELTSREAIEVSKGVSTEDKKLLNEFEKNFLKDED